MSDVCSICLGELHSDVGVVVPCGHCFHIKCFEEYLKHQRIDKSSNDAVTNDIGATLPSCPMCKQDTKMFQKIFLCVKIEDKKLTSTSSRSHMTSKSTSPSMDRSSSNSTDTNESHPMNSNASENQLSSANESSYFFASNPSSRSFHIDSDSGQEGYAISNQHRYFHQYEYSPSYPYDQYLAHTNIDTPMPPLPPNSMNSSFAIDSFQRSYFTWWQRYSRNNCYCYCYECAMSRRQYQNNVRYIEQQVQM